MSDGHEPLVKRLMGVEFSRRLEGLLLTKKASRTRDDWKKRCFEAQAHTATADAAAVQEAINILSP